MLPQQKEAILTFISSLVFVILLSLLAPELGYFRSEAIFIMLALFIVTLWIGRKIAGLKFKMLDEMEKIIRYQAALIAIHGFGAVVMVFAFILYMIHRETMTVPLHQVLQMSYYSYISLYLFWSGSILILYKTGAWNV